MRRGSSKAPKAVDTLRDDDGGAAGWGDCEMAQIQGKWVKVIIGKAEIPERDDGIRADNTANMVSRDRSGACGGRVDPIP